MRWPVIDGKCYRKADKGADLGSYTSDENYIALVIVKTPPKEKTLEDKFKEQKEKWADNNSETTELERILDGRKKQYWKFEDRIHALRYYLDSKSEESKRETVKIRESGRMNEIKKLLYQIKGRKSIQNAIDKGRLDSKYVSKTLKDIEDYLDNLPITYFTIKSEQKRLQRESSFKKPTEVNPSRTYENIVQLKPEQNYVQEPFEYYFNKRPKQKTWIKTAAKAALRAAAGIVFGLIGFLSLSGSSGSANTNSESYGKLASNTKIVSTAKPALSRVSKRNKDINPVEYPSYLPPLKEYNLK